MKKGRIISFLIGASIVTLITVMVTLAYLDKKPFSFIRNIVITNAIFVALNFIWIKLHKGYEVMYKSGLNEENK